MSTIKKTYDLRNIPGVVISTSDTDGRVRADGVGDIRVDISECSLEIRTRWRNGPGPLWIRGLKVICDVVTEKGKHHARNVRLLGDSAEYAPEFSPPGVSFPVDEYGFRTGG